MKFRLTALATAATTALGAPIAFAQAIPMRPDSVEVKRIGALAKVQSLALSARTSFDPKLQFSAPGQKGCTFNIGDLASAGLSGPPGTGPAARKGVARVEYVTVVETTPICVQR